MKRYASLTATVLVIVAIGIVAIGQDVFLSGVPITSTILSTVLGIDADQHNPQLWFGISADQSGNDWAADTLNPFQAISGLSDYGADANDEAKVVGSADTPARAGFTTFDVHTIQIGAVSVNTEYKLRLVWHSDNLTSGVAAGNTSETMLKFDATNPQQSAAIPVRVNMPAVAAGTKVWVQCKNATDNATVDLFVGITEF